MTLCRPKELHLINKKWTIALIKGKISFDIGRNNISNLSINRIASKLRAQVQSALLSATLGSQLLELVS
jgi:hypothetical protein